MINQQERYNKWAVNYNRDVKGRLYEGPEYIVSYLMELIGEKKIDLPLSLEDTQVLDVGCGTGLVGPHLSSKGFQHIDGIDYSPGMIEEARKTEVYRWLIADCDLRKSLPFFLHRQYDLVICCGVFSFDLVTASSLKHLIEVSKLGGIVLLSTRPAFCEKYGFEAYYQKLEQLGHLKLIDYRLNQSFLGEESKAHYWAFSVQS